MGSTILRRVRPAPGSSMEGSQATIQNSRAFSRTSNTLPPQAFSVPACTPHSKPSKEGWLKDTPEPPPLWEAFCSRWQPPLVLGKQWHGVQGSPPGCREGSWHGWTHSPTDPAGHRLAAANPGQGPGRNHRGSPGEQRVLALPQPLPTSRPWPRARLGDARASCTPASSLGRNRLPVTEPGHREPHGPCPSQPAGTWG